MARLYRQDAFTLVELLVVLIVLGLLLAVALPLFLGQQDGANDADAKTKVSIAYKAAKVIAASNEGAFTGGSGPADLPALGSAIGSAEPELLAEGSIRAGSVANDASQAGVVYLSRPNVAGVDNNDLLISVRSQSGDVCSAEVVDSRLVRLDCSVAESAIIPAISSSHRTVCYIASTGDFYCWGRNNVGQVGDGTQSTRSRPVAITGIGKVKSVSSGDGHGCVVLSSGEVKCWGSNVYGQLGDGTNISRYAPGTSVSGITNAVSVSAGNNFSCALLETSQVKCWGAGGAGRLGNGSEATSNTPVTVSGINNATSITTAGFGGHACALLSGGAVKCWGYNNWGQLGNGNQTNQSIPVQVSGISNALSVKVGTEHTCAHLSDGAVKCWGYNNRGQLGDGTTTFRTEPTTVTGLSGQQAVSVDAGGSHSCAAFNSGQVRCWGNNSSGQIGTGSLSPLTIASPVLTSGITSAVSVELGDIHSCAVLSDTSLKCWGRGQDGQLGNGELLNKTLPVSVLF